MQQARVQSLSQEDLLEKGMGAHSSSLENSINGGVWWLESMGSQRAYRQILSLLQAFLVAQMINNLPAMQDSLVQSMDWKNPWRGIDEPLHFSWASLVVQMVKNLLAIQETWV